MPFAESGSQLDHYSIGKMIARTDTAAIFEAVDERSGRNVALKIPHAGIEGDLVFYNRFLREREICEKLDHPAVIKGFADPQRTEIYIAMEFAEGRLLRQILNEEGKIPADRAVAITRRICDALDYIHAQGVVHRDLKPENIVLDAQDNVKLIDFGIAAQAGAKRLTFGKLSNVMGTPDYIAPEQVRGRRGDARTDVYALGVILFEMLTGTTPFRGANPYVVMHNRLVNRAPSVRELQPGISPQIEQIVHRSLEKEPANRYPSARELSRALLHPERITPIKLAGSRSLLAAIWAKPALFYSMLASIPVAIFVLLLLVARHT